jgi:acyl-CoA synthetase (NDP forming)
MSKGFGFSYFISSGNEAHLCLADFIEFLGEDPQTRVILSYVEGVREGRRLLEVAKRVTRKKPILMLKAGDTTAGARAALSHTAALSGSESAFAAAARQAGIIRVEDMDELINIGAAFTRQPLPKGRRVGIVTVGGGWGVLAADACAKAGLDVVQLPEETIRELDSFLPPWWSQGNPVDLVAGMREGDIENSLEALLRCPQVDGVIVLGIRGGFAKQDEGPFSFLNLMASAATDFFEDVPQLIDKYGKPVLLASDTSFGDIDFGKDVSAALGNKGLICYPLPNHAAVVFASMAQYGEYLRENGY